MRKGLIQTNKVQPGVYPSEELRQLEKKTFSLHMLSNVFMGLSFGILMLHEIILKKSLLGTDFQVTLLIFLSSSAFIFSIYGTELIHRSSNPAKTIIILALISRFFLFIIPLFSSPEYFIFCIAAMSYIDSLIKPSWNTVFKHNYSDSRRSLLYSYSSSLYTIVILIVSTVLGYLLDINYELYKILFPIAGIFDVLSYISLAKMITMGQNLKMIPPGIPGKSLSLKLMEDIFVLPVRNMMRIFKDNRPFLRFEVFFFMYGMAFMIASPAVPIYLVEVLQLSYSPISIAKGLVFYTATILFTPLMGRLHGTGNPTKFCGYLFLFLLFYPLSMMGVKFIPGVISFITPEIMLYFTFFLFGILMSGITMSWNLSTIYYAPHYQEANYQSVHITLTG
ncbi:MAG: MFS transporter [Ignavibacteria bacterium]|nr:MFS transporter [Ignavibacteria bacterium]